MMPVRPPSISLSLKNYLVIQRVFQPRLKLSTNMHAVNGPRTTDALSDMEQALNGQESTHLSSMLTQSLRTVLTMIIDLKSSMILTMRKRKEYPFCMIKMRESMQQLLKHRKN
jgi:hypothetical protein